MRLFFKLSEKEQSEVLHHCANIVIHDIIEGEIKIHPATDEEYALQEKLETAHKEMKDFKNIEEKSEYLMADESIAKAVYEIAIEMAKSAIYCEDDELVIYPSAIKQPERTMDEFEEVEETELRTTEAAGKEEVSIPQINTRKSKKYSELN